MKTRITTLANVSTSSCDICAIHKAKYDGKTFMGPWAFMCETCFDKFGKGLGIGKGQKLQVSEI